MGSRRNLIKSIPAAPIITLSGCANIIDDSPEFKARHQSQYDKSILKNRNVDKILVGEIITNKEQANEAIDIDNNNILNDYIDSAFPDGFLFVLSSLWKYIPPGSADMKLPSTTVSGAKFLVEFPSDTCVPDKVNMDEGFIELVEQWSPNSESIPSAVEIDTTC